MNLRALRFVLAVLPVVLMVPTTYAAPGAPGVGAGPTPVRPSSPSVKQTSKLEAKSTSGLPGETKTFEATLTAGGTPMANKSVTFKIAGKNGTSVPGGTILAGTDQTDASGVAKLSFALPELAQGNYTLSASFNGDDDILASKVDANLLMVKAITKVDMGALIYSGYKDEPGKTASFPVQTMRTTDNKALNKPITVTVNGYTWKIAPNTYHIVPLPSGPAQWTVKVQFEGDDANTPSAQQKTYVKPAS